LKFGRLGRFAVRIYVDESGTHASSGWLIIGMLFVPDHGTLHSELCAIKERLGYLNRTKRKARYKEIHLTEFKSERDIAVAREWIDAFARSGSYFRSIVINWSRWDGRHFGDAFDPDALKRRRAYKKWAEMLLQPEIGSFREASLYLDRLRILYGYDVLDHLRMRFEPAQSRWKPRIAKYQLSDSWTDAMQCLQLADLLTGAIAQRLTPSTKVEKRAVTDYLVRTVPAYRPDSPWGPYNKNITGRRPRPKFAEWVWKPEPTRKPRGKR
jgi:hypothetical protein